MFERRRRPGMKAQVLALRHKLLLFFQHFDAAHCTFEFRRDGI